MTDAVQENETLHYHLQHARHHLRKALAARAMSHKTRRILTEMEGLATKILGVSK